MIAARRLEMFVSMAVRALILVGIGEWQLVRKLVQDRAGRYSEAFDAYRAASAQNRKLTRFGREQFEFRKALGHAIYQIKESGLGAGLPENHDSPSADPLVIARAVIEKFEGVPKVETAVQVLATKLEGLETRDEAKGEAVKQSSTAYIQLVDAEADLEIALIEAKRFVRKNSARDSEAQRALKLPTKKSARVKEGGVKSDAQANSESDKPAVVPTIRVA